jgi:hypothetical protein
VVGELPQRKQTAEVRWFFAEPPFDRTILFPEAPTGHERIDWYAAVSDLGCGIKWREGRLETKLRLRQYARSEPLSMQAGDKPPIEGALESWTKWSVALEQGVEPPPADLLASTGWIEVRKTRYLRTFAIASGEVTEVAERPASGCDLEWTDLVIADRPWCTIGLESFGDAEWLTSLVATVIDHVLLPTLQQTSATTWFRRDNSYGYPHWLAEQPWKNEVAEH